MAGNESVDLDKRADDQIERIDKSIEKIDLIIEKLDVIINQLDLPNKAMIKARSHCDSLFSNKLD